MQYTNFGKTGLEVSRFGLGCMRFPKDEQDAITMVRYAIDHGVNYLDSAYMYKGSEIITGKALKNGYRDKIYMATKSPIWLIEKYDDFEKYLDEELVRLGTDHIDVYLLHNLNYHHWETVKKYDGLRFLDKMIEKGKILYKGFSVHNTLDAFKNIVDSTDWDMTQIQLNILDVEQQVGVAGLKYAAEKELAVVVMEPLRGGNLLTNIPEEVPALLEAYPEKRSLIEWCFRFLYDKPEVSLILSGTSTLDQLKENLRIMENAEPNVMREDDQKLIETIRGLYQEKNVIGCTGCEYCMPCPQNVAIPDIFRLYNSYQQYKTHFVDRFVYANALIPEGKGADQCIECGICESNCPQSLPIPDLLKKVHVEMTEANASVATPKL